MQLPQYMLGCVPTPTRACMEKLEAQLFSHRFQGAGLWGLPESYTVVSLLPGMVLALFSGFWQHSRGMIGVGDRDGR